MRRPLVLATALLPIVLVVTVIAVFRLSTSAEGWDTRASIAVVDRIERLGGTFYTTGADHKGPLWLATYDLALRLTNIRDIWFGLSSIHVLIAALTGLAVSGILRRWGASMPIAVTVGAVTWLHLCFGDEEYSRFVLYSRNIVIALSATAFWLLISRQRPLERPAVRLVIAGLLVGLGAQTVPLALITAVVLAAYLAATRQYWGTLGRPLLGSISQAALAFGVLVAGVVAAAPLWYVARGVFGDFWSQWWGYNSAYTQSTSQSLLEMLSQGAVRFTGYYARHWIQGGTLAVSFAVLAITFRGMRPYQRMIVIAVAAWWVAEVLAVALSQRFFGHYFVLPAVPLAVLGGLAMAQLWNQKARWRPGIIAVAALAVIVSPIRSGIAEGVKDAREFRGFRAAAEDRAAQLQPADLQLRSVVQRYTQPDDFVYIWSNTPYAQITVERPAAARYVENRWLTGLIYTRGDTPRALSGAYVPENAWRKWIEDMLAVNPAAIVIDKRTDGLSQAVPADSPFAELMKCSRLHLVDRSEVYDTFVPEGSLRPCLRAIRERRV